LVVSNGRGFGATLPARGDAPDHWIEVAARPPLAQLRTVRPGTAAEAGGLYIQWSVTDKNLGPEPIDLYYANQREGPWLSVARNLKNDGTYRWAVPGEAGPQVYIPLGVSDLAGNTTRCEAADAVPPDDLSPARPLRIPPPPGGPAAPPGN